MGTRNLMVDGLTAGSSPYAGPLVPADVYDPWAPWRVNSTKPTDVKPKAGDSGLGPDMVGLTGRISNRDTANERGDKPAVMDAFWPFGNGEEEAPEPAEPEGRSALIPVALLAAGVAALWILKG